MDNRTTHEKINHWTAYHKPDAKAVVQHENIKAAACVFMTAIADNTPPSADQSAALRIAREAMMTASAAVACGGK